MTQYQLAGDIFKALWHLFSAWWWLLLPFILQKPFLFLWLWWRQQIFTSKQEKVFLEVRIPKEILKPLKAMEDVLSGLWAIYDPPNWKEKWLEGKLLLTLSLELISVDGRIHFIIGAPKPLRKIVESNIYAEYPEAEISEVEDYTKKLPEDLLAAGWDLWGCSYQTTKPDAYPIKTYATFFEERGESLPEEKRIDPMAGLLEGMATLKEGEQLWIQILAKPITMKENDVLSRGKKIVEKIVGRPQPEKPKPIIQEAASILIFGPKEEEKKEEALLPVELKLTPGEREIVSAIERKTSKISFECAIRFIYLAKKDVFFKPTLRIPLSYFTQFSTQNLNSLKPWGKTVTKVYYFFTKKRIEFRKRRLLRLYRKRLQPLFPRPHPQGGQYGVFVLNTEELASLYHFPSRVVALAPALERVEAKKGEPPPGLPT